MNNFVNAPPLVRVLSLPPNHAEALENVDDVVDTPSLDLKLLGTLVQKHTVFLFLTVDTQKTSA